MVKTTTSLQDIKARYRIVGRDEKLDNALHTALQVARTDLSVLIQGESGVGKEVIPRIIHDNSPRRMGKYIAINCGSIPEGTIDSELFGHEKGSFTGAIEEREGYFGAADGGTLFLDEVGELPMTTQARLLRVLETGEYIRVGSDKPRKTNVRIVAATNVDIPSAIRDGLFREDLYYRLCTINIQMPALRNRGYDIVLLFKMFAMETASRYMIPEPARLDAAAEQVVMEYRWPGNVRQLKNIVEQISILEKSRTITPEILARYNIVPNATQTTEMARVGASGGNTSYHDLEEQIKWILKNIVELHQEIADLKMATGTEIKPALQNALPDMQNTLPTHHHNVVETHLIEPHREDTPASFDMAEEVVEEDDSLNLENMEKRNIIKALQRSHNRRKIAADMLGISERTLYRKINDYGIEE